MKLTYDAQTLLDKRIVLGARLIRLVWGRSPQDPDDRESAAKDAISDILTALLGPAGTTSGGEIAYDEERINDAHTLLYHALESYRGDAEDYYREPEEG